MKVALFLHAYQPPTQYPEVTLKIAQESYRPLIQSLIDYPQAKVTLNLTASLTEQLVNEQEDELLNKIGYLVNQGQIELTETAAYHPLLTMIPDQEIIRQSEVNNYINRKAIGEEVYQPRGYFLPEMVYERRVVEAIAKMGYEWVILDESAFPSATAVQKSEEEHFQLHIGNRIYKLNKVPLSVYFRNRPISLMIAFNDELTIKELTQSLAKHFLIGQEYYVVLAMDAETFGHHNPSNLDLLNEIFQHPNFDLVTISEISTFGFDEQEIEPVRSTWGVTLEDENQKRTFPRWDNPSNPVHQLQWELYNLALSFSNHQNPEPDLLDRALHSDQFWWASYNPCWHPGLYQRGAEMLRDSVLNHPEVTGYQKKYTQELYKQILQTGKEVYGEEVVNC